MKNLNKEEYYNRIEKFGPTLYQYVNIAEAMAGMFYPFSETVVHELSNKDRSIIAIYNGNVTGREVGDPVTNVVTRLVEGDIPDMVVGYENESPDGKKLKSSYTSIRNSKKEMIGVLGLNINVENLRRHKKILEKIITPQGESSPVGNEEFKKSDPENIDTPRSEIRDAIDNYCISQNLKLGSVGYEEKKDIVQYLHREGYFNIKKSVTIVSDLLNITRPSVYKYKKEAYK